MVARPSGGSIHTVHSARLGLGLCAINALPQLQMTMQLWHGNRARYRGPRSPFRRHSCVRICLRTDWLQGCSLVAPSNNKSAKQQQQHLICTPTKWGMSRCQLPCRKLHSTQRMLATGRWPSQHIGHAAGLTLGRGRHQAFLQHCSAQHDCTPAIEGRRPHCHALVQARAVPARNPTFSVQWARPTLKQASHQPSPHTRTPSTPALPPAYSPHPPMLRAQVLLLRWVALTSPHLVSTRACVLPCSCPR